MCNRIKEAVLVSSSVVNCWISEVSLVSEDFRSQSSYSSFDDFCFSCCKAVVNSADTALVWSLVVASLDWRSLISVVRWEVSKSRSKSSACTCLSLAEH